MEDGLFVEKIEYLNNTLESHKEEMTPKDQRKYKKLRSGEIQDRKAHFEQSATMLMKLDLRQKYLAHATGIKEDIIDLMKNFLTNMSAKDREFYNEISAKYDTFQLEIFKRLDKQNESLESLTKNKDEESHKKFVGLVKRTIDRNLERAEKSCEEFYAKLGIFHHLFESNYLPGGSRQHIDQEVEKGKNKNLELE